jgi:hypothetical protein
MNGGIEEELTETGSKVGKVNAAEPVIKSQEEITVKPNKNGTGMKYLISAAAGFVGGIVITVGLIYISRRSNSEANESITSLPLSGLIL